MPRIHPSAAVDVGAQLAEDVEVGPFAIIGPHVSIGAGTTVGAHALVEGHTTIGRANRIHPHAVLGTPPQDKKYAGEPTRLVIGDGNTFREFVTVNTGTVQDEGLTSIGDDCWIMAYVHVAHDCRLGSHLILANGTQLGGHVHLGDWVFLGGLTGVHQFVRVGAHAMTGFQTRLAQDLPPFVTAAGSPAEAVGINSEGLKRRGFGPERIAAVKRLYRTLFREKRTLSEAREAIAQGASGDAEVDGSADDRRLMLDFLARAERGIVR